MKRKHTHLTHLQSKRSICCILENVCPLRIERVKCQIDSEEEKLNSKCDTPAAFNLAILSSKRTLDDIESLLLICARYFAEQKADENLARSTYVYFHMLATEVCHGNFIRFRPFQAYNNMRRRLAKLQKSYSAYDVVYHLACSYGINELKDAASSILRASMRSELKLKFSSESLSLFKAEDDSIDHTATSTAELRKVHPTSERRRKVKNVRTSMTEFKNWRSSLRSAGVDLSSHSSTTELPFGSLLQSFAEESKPFRFHYMLPYSRNKDELSVVYESALEIAVMDVYLGKTIATGPLYQNVLRGLFFLAFSNRHIMLASKVVNMILESVKEENQEYHRFKVYRSFIDHYILSVTESKDIYCRAISTLSQEDKLGYYAQFVEYLICEHRFVHAQQLKSQLYLPKGFQDFQLTLRVFLCISKYSLVFDELDALNDHLSYMLVLLGLEKSSIDFSVRVRKFISYLEGTYSDDSQNLLDEVFLNLLTAIYMSYGLDNLSIMYEGAQKFKLNVTLDVIFDKILEIGILIFWRGNIKQAFTILQGLVELECFKRKAKAFLHLGMIMNMYGKHSEADSFLLKAKEETEKEVGKTALYATILIYLGSSLCFQFKIAKAEAYYDEANNVLLSNRGGEIPKIKLLFALSHMSLHKEEQYIKWIDHMLHALPLSRCHVSMMPWLYIGLAIAYSHVGDLLNADKFFKRAKQCILSEYATNTCMWNSAYHASSIGEFMKCWQFSLSEKRSTPPDGFGNLARIYPDYEELETGIEFGLEVTARLKMAANLSRVRLQMLGNVSPFKSS